MSVTAVLRTIRSVSAAMCASSVVGDEEKNGGLWCSPMAKTSRPTSSARRAIWTMASMRSASLGVCPVTAFRVMSLTEKIPNCIVDRLIGCSGNYSGECMTAHVPGRAEDPCIEEAGEQGADVRAGQPIEAGEAPGEQRRAADDQCRADDQAGGQAIDEDDGSGIVLQLHPSEHEEHASGEKTER